MFDAHDPNWLRFLSRRLQWLAIPNLAAVFIGLQLVGYATVLSDPRKSELLPLIPSLVFEGEFWRLATFLTVPMAMSPLWMLFALGFQYFVLNSIESEWGEFKTTFYVFTSVILTVLFSLLFGYPIMGISEFASTLFLAAAALFPEHEIRLYFLIPVKLKILGWLALGFLALRLIQGDWMDRFFLLTIYSNYFIFFGPTLLFRLKEWKRRRDYRANWK